MEICWREDLIEMDSAEFKKRFKKGDVLVGWTGSKAVQITAIGLKRFFYVNYPVPPEGYGISECASTMNGKWKKLKLKPKKLPKGAL